LHARRDSASRRLLHGAPHAVHGAEQVALHAARVEAERRRDLLGRPSFEVAEDEHFALSRREAEECAPDAAAALLAERGLLGGPPGGRQLAEVDGGGPPRAPPARPPTVTAGIDRDPGEPGTPGHGPRSLPMCAQQLHEYLLGHVLRLGAVGEEK